MDHSRRCAKAAIKLERFDRKTFDPVNNPLHNTWLSRLRHPGRFRQEPSKALQRALQHISLPTAHKPVFADLGCGDSNDYRRMMEKGCTVFRFDLVKPWVFLPHLPTTDWASRVHFTKADVVEHIPLIDNLADVLISQAMYDLIEPQGRVKFFQEADRVLSPNGVFACHMVRLLSGGWGLDMEQERARAISVWGERRLHFYSDGFVVKPEQK